MTVRVTSTLPIPAQVVAELMSKPALLGHVTWPILRVSGLPETFEVGQRTVVHLALLGVVPRWSAGHVQRRRGELDGAAVRRWFRSDGEPGS